MEEDDSYDIAIAHAEGLDHPISEPLLRAAIAEALRRHGVRAAVISIALVDDAKIARLNKDHLNHDRPTDVLTFDLRENVPDADTHHTIEGEIVISAETAEREAQRRGHTAEAEAALYAVHGVLHLLGYDDHSESQAERMHESEDAILSAIDVGPVYRDSQP